MDLRQSSLPHDGDLSMSAAAVFSVDTYLGRYRGSRSRAVRRSERTSTNSVTPTSFLPVR